MAEERYVFVVLLACLRAFAYMLVLLFFHIIENCYLAAVRLSPCSVSFCFDRVMTMLVFCIFQGLCYYNILHLLQPFYKTDCLF